MAVSSSLKKLPFEAQQFRQYCLNSKVFSIGDQPKFVYLVTKGEFAIIKYCKVTTNNPFQILQKLFQQDKMIPKQVKLLKVMDVFALDEIYEDKYSYEVICNTPIGEVFCIRHQVFEKVKIPVKKKPLQIEVYDQPMKPPIMEIQSAKGSTPMNRLYLNQIPRRPEEISTHRHEKKTIDFNSYRVTQMKKIQQTEIIQEIEEPPLNNRFMEDF